MANGKTALLEGLLKAIQSERDGHSFYMMAANSTEDVKGKDMFAMLASEELDHMQFLRAQYDSILNTGKPDRSAKLGPRADLSGGFPIFSDGIRARITQANFEMSALSIGIRLELDAMKFYQSQSKAADDPQIKGFFAELADWESGHYHALLKQQEALKEDYWSAGGFAPF
jgi:rubrerythrin